MRYIEVQGKVYTELGCYGGNIHLGRVFDLNNEVVDTGCIWNKQPWKYKSLFYSIRTNFLRWCLSIYTKSNTWNNTVHNNKVLTEKIYGFNKYRSSCS